MALDVQTSPANALFANERTASTKARGNEKAKARTNAAALEAAPAKNASSHSFNALVSEREPAGKGPHKVITATHAPRSRGIMPGQIAGHQDTIVSRREEASELSAAPKAETSTPQGAASTKSEVAQRQQTAGGEKAQNAEAPGMEGSETERTAQSAGDEATLEHEAARQDTGEQTGQDSRDTSDTGTEAAPEGKTDAAASISGAPAGTPPVTGPGVVGPVASAIDGVSAEGEAVLALGGAGKEGSAAMPVGGAVQTEGAVSAETPAGAPDAAAKAKAGPAPMSPVMAEAAKAGAPQDISLQAGMTEHGKANAARIAEAAAEGTLIKGDKASKASGEASLESKFGSAQPGDGPALRGSVFTQMLSDFAGEHGFNRAPDLLSGLDRAVAATAQVNRGADVQRPTPLQMLPIEIGMQAVRGAREFQIRLDPAELGRVDVKLQINDKGEVNASLVVERPETLQMLRRDATTLAQAFEQAGLKQGENALSFSLKGEHQQGQQHQPQGRNASVQDSEDAALQAQIGEIAMRRVMIPNSSLDRMV